MVMTAMDDKGFWDFEELGCSRESDSVRRYTKDILRERETTDYADRTKFVVRLELLMVGGWL